MTFKAPAPTALIDAATPPIVLGKLEHSTTQRSSSTASVTSSVSSLTTVSSVGKISATGYSMSIATRASVGLGVTLAMVLIAVLAGGLVVLRRRRQVHEAALARPSMSETAESKATVSLAELTSSSVGPELAGSILGHELHGGSPNEMEGRSIRLELFSPDIKHKFSNGGPSGHPAFKK